YHIFGALENENEVLGAPRLTKLAHDPIGIASRIEPERLRHKVPKSARNQKKAALSQVQADRSRPVRLAPRLLPCEEEAAHEQVLAGGAPWEVLRSMHQESYSGLFLRYILRKVGLRLEIHP